MNNQSKILFFFLFLKGKTYKFHLIPSGILHPGTVCVIGNGVVVHIPSLIKELKMLKDAGINYEGRILLSDRAHLVFDFHQQVIPLPHPPPLLLLLYLFY